MPLLLYWVYSNDGITLLFQKVDEAIQGLNNQGVNCL